MNIKWIITKTKQNKCYQNIEIPAGLNSSEIETVANKKGSRMLAE